MRQRVVGILKYLLVVIFVAYYASSTFFVHTHRIDGNIVTHSHPYLPSGNHTHSSAAILLIQQLNDILFTGGLLTLSVAVYPVLNIIFRSYKLFTKGWYHTSNISLRAPPVC